MAGACPDGFSIADFSSAEHQLEALGEENSGENLELGVAKKVIANGFDHSTFCSAHLKKCGLSFTKRF